MSLRVTILGSNSAVPAHGRHPSAQLIEYENTALLLDCGEGTQMRMLQHGVKRSKLEHILISHLHGDHYFGLIGLLTSFNLLGHNRPIHIYTYPALEAIIRMQLEASGLQLRISVTYHTLPTDDIATIIDEPAFTVQACPLVHRIPCCGFIFREKQKPRKLNARAAKSKGIPHTAFPSLKEGVDYYFPDGTRVPASEVTFEPTPSYGYAYFTDTLPVDTWDTHLRGIDMLYHEATFLHEQATKAQDTYHTTALQAAQVAQRAGAGKLLLGHFSAKYKDLTPLLEEARQILPHTELAIEGHTFEIGQ
jgi:ribonuclease Z